MFDPQNTIDRLETVKKKIHELTGGYHGNDSAEIMNTIIGYVEILHLIPEIQAWIENEKRIWLSNGSSFGIPNIWTSYQLLDSLYNFHRKGIEEKPSDTYFLYEDFIATHNQIVIYLHQLQLSKKQDATKPVFSFKEDGSLLQIDRYCIKIAERKENTFSHQLIAYIFSHDLTAKFTFYEIMNEAFGDIENDNWRRCYTAAMAIQNKIDKETKGVYPDFFDISSGKNGYIRINPKYIHI